MIFNHAKREAVLSGFFLAGRIKCNGCGAKRQVTPRELGITPHRLREMLVELTAMLANLVEHHLTATQPDGDPRARIVAEPTRIIRDAA